MSSEPFVYIVTLNWNRCADTLAFLESCSQLGYANCRLLLVDNASIDGSVEAVAARFPQVERLVNERNLGFAAGMNAGICLALQNGAEYVFLANNDTLLAPDMLTELLVATQERQADLASPAIFYASRPDDPWSLGGWRRSLTLEVAPCHQLPGSQPFEVDFITGCGMLLSRRCLETVGLFDERFFMYYEDFDYCLRARQAGCRMLLVPRAKMWHKVAVSIGGSDSPGERYHMALASVQFFKKHVRGWRWLVVGPYRTGSAIKTTLRLLQQGNRSAAWAYWRGLGAGIRKDTLS